MADDVKTIKSEYLRGELSLIDAIEALQALGWSPRDAEAEVYGWEEQ
jgi:hypothetical protein